jgi:hypothetical protein
MQRLFQTNYWGVVHGSLEAVKHMKTRGGGAIINLGSELSDHAVPLQGIYAASKHAVKAFTDSLRMELEKESAPIAVTLIKPAAIDTMFVAHAKNYMDKEPSLPPPVYAPELVAKAILYAAQHPKRDVFVGGAQGDVGRQLRDAGACSTATCARRCSSSSRPTSPAPEPPRRPARPESATRIAPAPGHGRRAHVIERAPTPRVAAQGNKIMPVLLGAGALFAAWKLAGAGRAHVVAHLSSRRLRQARKEASCQSNSRN